MKQTTQHVPQKKARGTTVLAAIFLGAAALVLTAPASLALIDDDLVPDLPTESPLEPVESLLGTPVPVPSEATEDIVVTPDLTIDNPLGEILDGEEDGGNDGGGGGGGGGGNNGGGNNGGNGGGGGAENGSGTNGASGSSGTASGSGDDGAEIGEAPGTTAGDGTYGPASATTGTLSVSYGTFAGRAAANTAGRALRMAGPLAAPLVLAAVALATLLALGRGPNRLIKSEAVATRRTYRL